MLLHLDKGSAVVSDCILQDDCDIDCLKMLRGMRESAWWSS